MTGRRTSSRVSYETLEDAREIRDEAGRVIARRCGNVPLGALALRAYRQGFHDGTDLMAGRRRHQVDPATHEHWRAGFEEGRRAAEAASTEYGIMLAGRGL